MNEQEWDKEVDYCEKVYRSRGDENMKAHQVPSYLNMQVNAARREGFLSHAKLLQFLLDTYPAP